MQIFCLKVSLEICAMSEKCAVESRALKMLCVRKDDMDVCAHAMEAIVSYISVNLFWQGKHFIEFV